MNSHSNLTWSPTIHFVRDILNGQQQLFLIIAPFIKLDPLKTLVETCRDISNLQVVARWRADDLIQKVTDIDIYPYLKEKGIPLFIHNSIHLKLLVLDRSLAFHSSGNITSSGLGIETTGNVEIGCLVQLRKSDWWNLYRVLAESVEVDDFIYETARKYVCDYNMTKKPLHPLTLSPASNKDFSRSSLPASQSPKILYQFYSRQSGQATKHQIAAACVNDLVTFRIPSNLDEPDFYSLLSDNFCSHPFITALVEFIRSEKSVRFGAVNAWLTDNCTDAPRPYSRDMKTTCRTLYDWLSFFYEEITWDQPHVSMIIRWNAELA